jgi:hypothetical protein
MLLWIVLGIVLMALLSRAMTRLLDEERRAMDGE